MPPKVNPGKQTIKMPTAPPAAPPTRKPGKDSRAPNSKKDGKTATTKGAKRTEGKRGQTATQRTRRAPNTAAERKSPSARQADGAALAPLRRVTRASTRKAYTRPQFRRPRTHRRRPMVKPSVNANRIKNSRGDEHRIIRYPISSDVAMKKLEENNTLTFIVDPRANKTAIKKAMLTLYKVKSAKVNTLIRPDGLKKAYVRLNKAFDALDLAGKIGIV